LGALIIERRTDLDKNDKKNKNKGRALTELLKEIVQVYKSIVPPIRVGCFHNFGACKDSKEASRMNNCIDKSLSKQIGCDPADHKKWGGACAATCIEVVPNVVRAIQGQLHSLCSCST
jgi:hypothetical protein